MLSSDAKLNALCDPLQPNTEVSAGCKLRNGKIIPSQSSPSESIMPNTGNFIAGNQTFTWVKEDIDHPKFTGTGHETLYDFFRRVDDKILRRKIEDDKEKIAVLKSRVTSEETNEVFLALKFPSLRDEGNYEKFKKGLSEALGVSKEKGLFHVIAKHTEDVIKAHGITQAASALVKGGDAAREICENIRGSSWVDGDDAVKLDKIELILAAIFFSLRIHHKMRDVIKAYDFDRDTNLTTVLAHAKAHKQIFKEMDQKRLIFTSTNYDDEPVRAVVTGSSTPCRNESTLTSV